MPRKPFYYETGPSWDMVEQWLDNYQDCYKRQITITLGFNRFRNGHTALFVSCVSLKRDARGKHTCWHETCWFWPHKGYISLPAMVVGLIGAHEKETNELQERWDRGYEALPVEELPLFHTHE